MNGTSRRGTPWTPAEEENHAYLQMQDVPDGAGVSICGPLSLRTTELLFEIVDHEDPRTSLTIDLSQTTFPDGRAVRRLVDEVERRRRHGLHIRVKGSSVRLLGLHRLDGEP
ncbi:hypothetical protein EXU48_14740 [Occultella glacieicola]|uniref:STAS domain-containing protein n=1 Tax=Occultella glacieicola TaxID=2518684 RepID=A0ABY2E4K3_9MICO|nr:hypothetical protein [Occultella glacieicola]TDE92768.1 hypothetical protein EXU48_14740 [Occultella glacieicola]